MGRSQCGFPEISLHNGYPWNGRTDYECRLIGIMYAGRNEEDTMDDIVFYGMNTYWNPLDLQLPTLPEGRKWKVCVNTFVAYEDGKDIEEETEFQYGTMLKIPPRTAVVLVAE
jgi:glycogen operon protein